MRTIICGALTALSVTAAEAAEDPSPSYSANTMLPYCKALISEGVQATNAVAASYCGGMLAMLSYLAPSLGPDYSWMCMRIPKSATIAQIARVVVRYIEARPERMHESFFQLTVEAGHSTRPRSAFCARTE
jgi:hypothetical protein